MLLTQAATTWALTGIIWFVQLVQYPSFATVDATSFPAFHARHSAAITPIVAPLMIAEAISAVGLLVADVSIPRWQLWVGIGLVGVVWGSTFFLQVPEHQRLASGFDVPAWETLVRTNWIRTAAWSLRACLVTYWLFLVLGRVP